VELNAKISMVKHTSSVNTILSREEMIKLSYS